MNGIGTAGEGTSDYKRAIQVHRTILMASKMFIGREVNK